MKKLTTGKIWQFAAGQFGWAMLSGIISNWLVYFYQPDKTAISQGQTVFIPQGLVVFGIFTIIGGITAFGRIFDAFTDPMIASLSDRCTSKNGRRIPFLKWASLPLALSTVLVFWSPVNKNSWINGVFLLIMILAYYLSITAYCTPYNALIPELGHTQQERLNISTVISFTFIAGTAVAYLAPTIWGMFIPAFGRVGAIRMTFTLMAAIAFICMLVPVFCIREKDYVDTVPAKESAFGSLAATFKNGEFRKFVASMKRTAVCLVKLDLCPYLRQLNGQQLCQIQFIAQASEHTDVSARGKRRCAQRLCVRTCRYMRTEAGGRI